MLPLASSPIARLAGRSEPPTGMLPTSAASINCRAALILPLAALGLSTVLAVLAVLPGIDWGHLVRVAPLSLAQPGWVSMAGAAAVVCGLGVAIATANRSREGGPR